MFFSSYLKRQRINRRIIVQILIELKSLNEPQVCSLILVFDIKYSLYFVQFIAHLGIFYQILVQLMMDDSEYVRRALQPVWRRIGAIKGGIRTNVTLKPPTHLPVR